jgi:hypothetical protein
MGRSDAVNENDAQLMASSGQDGLRTDSFGARRVQLAIQLFGPTLEHRPGRRFQPRRSPLNIAVASAPISGIAFAQSLEEVTVQGTRMVNTKTAGRTATGIPIVDVSLSYGVSTAGDWSPERAYQRERALDSEHRRQI